MLDSYPTWSLGSFEAINGVNPQRHSAAAYLNSGTALMPNLLRYLPSNTKYLPITAFVSSVISSNQNHDDIIVGRDR